MLPTNNVCTANATLLVIDICLVKVNNYSYSPPKPKFTNADCELHFANCIMRNFLSITYMKEYSCIIPPNYYYF